MSKRLVSIGLILVVVLAAAVFYSGLTAPFLGWDDDVLIVHNPLIQHLDGAHLRAMFSGPYEALYIPVQLLSYAVDVHFWGMEPLGFHLTNLYIHLANVVLLAVVLKALSVRPAVIIFSVLVFSIHPIQAESVNWISDRKTLLCCFFMLPAYIFYRRGASEDRPGRVGGLTVLFMVLSVLSKPASVVLPLLLAADDVLLRRQGLPGSVIGKWPLFIVAALATAASIAAHAGEDAMGALLGGTVRTHALTMIGGIAVYLEHIFYPIALGLFYEPEIIRGVGHVRFLTSAIVLLGTAILCLRPGARGKRFGFWLLWWLILLLPAFNIVPTRAVFNDRYAYLALAGAAVFTGEFMWLLLERLGLGRARYGAVLFLAGTLAVAVPLVLITRERNRIWSDETLLWQEAVSRAPGQPVPYDRLGLMYHRTDQPDRAEAAFREAISRDPSFQPAYAHLGSLLRSKGEVREAISVLEKGLTYGKTSYLLSPLAVAYDRAGNRHHALTLFREAAELRPLDSALHFNLGLAEWAQGNREAGVRALEEALRLEPANARYRNELLRLENLTSPNT